jgi:hypothetical protein
MEKTKQNGVLHRLRKNIMCGVLSCALALGAALIMPGMTARADDNGEEIETVDNVKYSYFDNNDHTCRVTNQNPSIIGEEVHIVAKITHNGKPYDVTTISNLAFDNCKKLKKITIDEGIKIINTGAFKDTSIEEIELPASIELLDMFALGGCPVEKIRFRGINPPGFHDRSLGGVKIIEIPEGADRSAWEKAIDPNGTGYSFKIQTYNPVSSSSSSSNQENNSNGEVEFIEEEPVNRIPEHVCQYEWEVVREVGADQDGLEQYLCKLCGNVQSTLTIPASQYQVQELYTKVTGAGEGETVTYDTGMVHTVCDKLFTKLQQRKDVTLVITYQYKGENYRTTFPARADYTELLQDADQFYGMLGLNGRCGIVTEKN